MENTSNPIVRKPPRDIYYFRQRLKNRFFGKIAAFFAEEAERRGITKKDIATALSRDPAQISRWLSSPSNMTLETISDLLMAMDAEIDGPLIVRLSERPRTNNAHPLIDAIITRGANRMTERETIVRITLAPPSVESVTDSISTENADQKTWKPFSMEAV